MDSIKDKEPTIQQKRIILKELQSQLIESLETVKNHPMSHLLHSGTCKSCQIPFSSRRIRIFLKDCGHDVCGFCFMRNTSCSQCGSPFSLNNLDIDREAPERAQRMYQELQEKKDARAQKRQEDEEEWKKRKQKILDKQKELKLEIKRKLRQRALEIEEEKEQKLRILIERERKKMEDEHQLRQTKRKQIREEKRKREREIKIQKQKSHFKHQEFEKINEQFLLQQREKIIDLDLKKITVAIRISPLRDSLSSMRAVKQINENTLQVSRFIPRHFAEGKRTIIDEFQFNHVWSGTFPIHSILHKHIGSKVVNAACNGINTTIFSFGQSSTGKSYLMFGGQTPSDEGTVDDGIVPMIGRDLFEQLASQYQDRWEMQVSFIEIYHERTRDLLSSNEEYHSNSIYETTNGQVQVKGVRKHVVKSFKDYISFVKTALSRRHTCSTQLNTHSSRSHVVMTIYLSYASIDHSSSYIVQTETNLVDLAGFERMGKGLKNNQDESTINPHGGTTKKVGQIYNEDTFNDGTSINKSLLELGICLQRLAEMPKQTNIHSILFPKKLDSDEERFFLPTRSSTLTWLLKNSLLGKAKIFMIGTISPLKQYANETLATLYYASQAMSIVTSEELKKKSVKPIEIWQDLIHELFEKITNKYSRFCEIKKIYNRKDIKYKKIVFKIKDLISKCVALTKKKVMEIGKDSVIEYLENEFDNQLRTKKQNIFYALISLFASQFPSNYWIFIDSEKLLKLKLEEDNDLYDTNHFHDVTKIDEKQMAIELIQENETSMFDFRKMA